jgi:hypothetical protein
MIRTHSRACAVSVTPAQLDRGRQLATTIERGADGGGLSLGDGEHRRSMGDAHRGRQAPKGCDLWAGDSFQKRRLLEAIQCLMWLWTYRTIATYGWQLPLG